MAERRGPGGPERRQSLGHLGASVYQGAVEAVVAMLIAIGLGYWLDQRFETSPRYLFVGVILGFGSFILRLFRLGRQMQPPTDGTGDDPANRGERRGQP